LKAGSNIVKTPNHANIIEVLGRNHLIAQLIEDGVHAAVPLWDQGVDLLAYYEHAGGLVARPLQLKVSEISRWGVYKKYAAIPALLMVHAWHVKQSQDVEIYAMSYTEAVELLTTTSTYATTATWKKPMGHYDTSPVRNNSMLWNRLQPFRMGQGKWKERLQRS
jgi:hypothetical protein